MEHDLEHHARGRAREPESHPSGNTGRAGSTPDEVLTRSPANVPLQTIALDGFAGIYVEVRPKRFVGRKLEPEGDDEHGVKWPQAVRLFQDIAARSVKFA